MWDHSAIHYGVPIDLGSKRPWAVFLGATGTYWFAETLRLCQLTSLNLAGVVEGVMRDRPAALRQSPTFSFRRRSRSVPAQEA